MITYYPIDKLGKADHDWLRSNHHFSFANYYNPTRMGFGTLRVVNDDWVAAATGFPTHSHKNMEIISFIRSGAITHQDSAGNAEVTVAGEVQVMSAGTGISHSEYNLTKEPLTFYQIWIEPNKRNVKPRWESKPFSKKISNIGLPLLVSGYKEDKCTALFINQHARIYGGKVKRGSQFDLQIEHQAYILASAGIFKVTDNQSNIIMSKGDGAEVTKQKVISFRALEDSEIIVIDAPKN